jgi:hypothetical protein
MGQGGLLEVKNSLTSTLVTGDSTSLLANAPTWAWWIAGSAIVVGALFLLVVWMKGRPFAPGAVFRASRLSSGNRLLPTQVLITPASVVQYTPGWIGKQEESIHMAHIASVKIQTGVLLSNVMIETSGGASPIRCHGHRKADAVEMKRLIELHQDQYYRAGNRPSGSTAVPPPPVR